MLFNECPYFLDKKHVLFVTAVPFFTKKLFGKAPGRVRMERCAPEKKVCLRFRPLAEPSPLRWGKVGHA